MNDRWRTLRRSLKPKGAVLCVRCGKRRIAHVQGRQRILCEECETRSAKVLRKLAEHGNRDRYIVHLLTVARLVDVQKGIAPMEGTQKVWEGA